MNNFMNSEIEEIPFYIYSNSTENKMQMKRKCKRLKNTQVIYVLVVQIIFYQVKNLLEM